MSPTKKLILCPYVFQKYASSSDKTVACWENTQPLWLPSDAVFFIVLLQGFKVQLDLLCHNWENCYVSGSTNWNLGISEVGYFSVEILVTQCQYSKTVGQLQVKVIPINQLLSHPSIFLIPLPKQTQREHTKPHTDSPGHWIHNFLTVKPQC